MSGAIVFDVDKAQQALSFCLKKHEVTQILPCQVHLAMDVSGSFHDEHHDGYTQELLNRFVPFALLFDKNKTIDSYIFGTGAAKIDDVNESNFANYIRNCLIKASGFNTYAYGTSYKPIFELLLKEAGAQVGGFLGGLFGNKTETASTSERHLVFFITDGEAGDQDKAAALLASTLPKVKNPFFVFIGVPDSEEDDLTFFSRRYANTEYSSYLRMTKPELLALKNLSNEDLYDKVLSPQLVKWMNG